MAKTVINLVKELGVKKTSDVMELLEQVGVNTHAEGFGVMTRIDDDIVAKLQQMRNAGSDTSSVQGALAAAAVEPVAAPKATSTRRQVEEDAALDLKAGVKRTATKDFFGSRQKPAVTAGSPTAAGASETRSPAQRPAGAEGTQAAAVRQPRAEPGQPARPAPAQRPDLSGGPRIISMPDPNDRRTASRPAGGGPAPVGDKKKIGAGGRAVGAKDKRKDDDAGGRRRKLKDIAVTDTEDDRLRSRKRVFKIAGQRAEPSATVVPHIRITGPMQLREVAGASGIKVAEIVRFLMRELSIMAGINHVATVDEIQLIADHFGIKQTLALEDQPESELEQFEQVSAENLQPRPPVVTIMGHVDHGKTKLLDTIRTANVIAGEAGGITQHIGAYQVEKKGKHVTFIDTPGHEAFTAMRARGSQVTDIVILVVAADDGVMPQTVEAVNHAKAANVPIIVAVNKMDKPDANPDRIKTQLSEHGLTPEEWGGDVVFSPVSALKAEGIDELLDSILLASELIDPKADPTAPPFGVVIESQVDTGIGVVATVLVQQGTLVKGQFILSGTSVGRIKRMENERGEEIEVAGPSAPVRIIGFTDPPENGDRIYAFANKKQAQAIADDREAQSRVASANKASGRMSLESFFAKASAGELKELNLIVKADVGGSAEALTESLNKLNVEGVKTTVISTGVGQINETDINLAAASKAVVIGFHVGVSGTAKKLAEREHVQIKLYDIIYKVTEDIELAMKGMLDPEYEEKPLGRVEVRAIFKSDKSGTSVVAGGYVLDGVARRNAKFRLRRGQEVIFENGTLGSLRRFKDDVREVASGFECGFLLETGNVPSAEGDILELYEVVAKARF
jgi:translation initiation factor IF-2